MNPEKSKKEDETKNELEEEIAYPETGEMLGICRTLSSPCDPTPKQREFPIEVHEEQAETAADAKVSSKGLGLVSEEILKEISATLSPKGDHEVQTNIATDPKVSKTNPCLTPKILVMVTSHHTALLLMVFPSVVPTGSKELGLALKEVFKEPIDFILGPHHLGVLWTQGRNFLFGRSSQVSHLTMNPRIKEAEETTNLPTDEKARPLHQPDRLDAKGKVTFQACKPTNLELYFVGQTVLRTEPSQGGGNDEARGAEPARRGTELKNPCKHPPDQEVSAPLPAPTVLPQGSSTAPLLIPLPDPPPTPPFHVPLTIAPLIIRSTPNRRIIQVS